MIWRGATIQKGTSLSFWRPDIYWTDRLHWSERVGIAVWWLGQSLFAVSVLGSGAMVGAALYSPVAGMSNTTILEGALAILLAGTAALVGSRLILGIAIRTSDTRGS